MNAQTRKVVGVLVDALLNANAGRGDSKAILHAIADGKALLRAPKGFSDYREEKIREDDVASHAECLAAMDCLMHHMNDEDEMSCWLQDGVPDNPHWYLLHSGSPGVSYAIAADRARFYENHVKEMTYGDYEACVEIFACAVKAQCFNTKYQPRSFT